MTPSTPPPQILIGQAEWKPLKKLSKDVKDIKDHASSYVNCSEIASQVVLTIDYFVEYVDKKTVYLAGAGFFKPGTQCTPRSSRKGKKFRPIYESFIFNRLSLIACTHVICNWRAA